MRISLLKPIWLDYIDVKFGLDEFVCHRMKCHYFIYNRCSLAPLGGFWTAKINIFFFVKDVFYCCLHSWFFGAFEGSKSGSSSSSSPSSPSSSSSSSSSSKSSSSKASPVNKKENLSHSKTATKSDQMHTACWDHLGIWIMVKSGFQIMQVSDHWMVHYSSNDLKNWSCYNYEPLQSIWTGQ